MKYVVYGLGISGISAINFLAKNNEQIIATDDNLQKISDSKKNLSQKNPDLAKKTTFLSPNDIDFDENTTVIFAPGIPLYHPKPHKILEICQKTKAKLTCDLEVFYNLNTQNDFIGITGTNGKSTVTALVGFILEELNIESQIGGNIGLPCFDLEQKADTAYVFETSSYQLDLINDIHFKVSALLNITPDHIDRHGSMQGYINSKKTIFKQQKPGDFAIINIDNAHSKQIFDELEQNQAFKSDLIAISTHSICKNGVSLKDKMLYNRIAGQNFKFELGEIFLKGKHNEENIATAFAILYCYLKQKNLLDESTQSKIIAAIQKFKGLKHRMQFVGTIDNINFINDSKATNAISAKNALEYYDNIFWILGGKSKEGGITELVPYFNKIKKAFLIGDASDEFAQILQKNDVKFEKCNTLANAIEKSFFEAKNHSLKEKNILLSPACASFDQWKSFEQRGDFFCKSFNELQNLHKD